MCFFQNTQPDGKYRRVDFNKILEVELFGVDEASNSDVIKQFFLGSIDS